MLKDFSRLKNAAMLICFLSLAHFYLWVSRVSRAVVHQEFFGRQTVLCLLGCVPKQRLVTDCLQISPCP